MVAFNTPHPEATGFIFVFPECPAQSRCHSSVNRYTEEAPVSRCRDIWEAAVGLAKLIVTCRGDQYLPQKPCCVS